MTPIVLPREFYARPTLDVARDLIGKVLVNATVRSRTAGIIVEVEVYRGEDDPACHAACGPTARNRPLYGVPGHAYVYLNYGVHHLMNAVTESVGSPAAVLIRALEPVEGVGLMRRRRARSRPAGSSGLIDHALCRGPGCLARALAISLTQNGHDLTFGPLVVEDRGVSSGPVTWGPRVGIRVGTDRPWRCHVTGHPAVSKARLSRR